MSFSSYKFIEPHILATISNLNLLAKTVIDGFMLGAHQSPKPGTGLEFNQYRSYQPGDDLRRVDWKMYARSDRYYVRESEIETSVNIHFVLDASASMVHEDGGISKFDYARFLIASLGYLAHGQGDGIGLHILNDRTVSFLPSRREHQHLHRFLHKLEEVRPEGIWPSWDKLEDLFTSIQHREMIIFVSDMHEQQDEIFNALSELSALKNEVLLFHIMGRNELEFKYKDFLTFEDLETGKTIQVNTDLIRKAYVEKIRGKIESLRQKLHKQYVEYELFTLDQPLDYALRKYISQRTNLT